MEEKIAASEKKREKTHASIKEKQRRREEKAKRVRMRAKKMKEDDVADLNVDPDETYNADEEGVLLCQKTNNNTRSHQRLILGSAVEFEGRNK